MLPVESQTLGSVPAKRTSKYKNGNSRASGHGGHTEPYAGSNPEHPGLLAGARVARSSDA